MSKKKKLILIVICCILFIIFVCFLYHYIRIKTAKIEVVLNKDLKVEFNSDVKISELISDINGKIIDDDKIDTKKLGKKKIKFQFINDDNIKVPYEFEVEIVDTVEPLIWLTSTYRVPKNSDIKLTDAILCGDNYDANPKCYIEGDYDLSTVGDYSLVFKAEDSSGNKEQMPFTLTVYEPDNTKKNTTTPQEVSYTDFLEIVKNYKTKKTKIGLDVSKWQGDIDFKKIKELGVEFLMVRVGGTRGKDGEYFIDEKFKQNMEGAKKVGIPVGVYFYSYADSSKKAIKDAKWVLRQIKNYDIKLPIAFDWEEWKSFNEYHLSFFGLTSMAEDFIKEVEKKGYKGMIYSSKTYLENVWLNTDYDIWLAHYTKQTNYDKDYKMWQLCDDGKIEGINNAVDIDILYEK